MTPQNDFIAAVKALHEQGRAIDSARKAAEEEQWARIQAAKNEVWRKLVEAAKPFFSALWAWPETEAPDSFNRTDTFWNFSFSGHRSGIRAHNLLQNLEVQFSRSNSLDAGAPWSLAAIRCGRSKFGTLAEAVFAAAGDIDLGTWQQQLEHAEQAEREEEELFAQDPIFDDCEAEQPVVRNLP